MLSIMNEVDHSVASAVVFVWDAKQVFPTYIYVQGHNMLQDMMKQ